MGGVRKFPFAKVIRLLTLQLDLSFKRKNRDLFIENSSSNNCFNKSSLSFLNRVNVETKWHSKQQRLSSWHHVKGGTNSNNACAVPCETKCEHSMPLVLPDQSTTEIIKIMPRSGKKGKRPSNIIESAPAN